MSVSTTDPSSSPTRSLTGAGSTAPTPSSSTLVHRGRTPGPKSFNGRLRDEHLNGQQFDSLLEVQVLTEDWRIDYNMNRPHSAHGWLTPVEFIEEWLNQQQLALA
jgi:transposase InsO family protein